MLVFFFFFVSPPRQQTWENVLSFRIVWMDPPVPLLYDTLEHNPRRLAVHISSEKKITSDRMMTERKLTYKYNNTTDTRTWILNIISCMYVDVFLPGVCFGLVHGKNGMHRPVPRVEQYELLREEQRERAEHAGRLRLPFNNNTHEGSCWNGGGAEGAITSHHFQMYYYFFNIRRYRNAIDSGVHSDNGNMLGRVRLNPL